MIKAILFDLDGTLLPLDDKIFTKMYFNLLTTKMTNHNYDPQELLQVILNGTKLMYNNDGAKTNERVFWDYVNNHYGENKEKDKPIFDKFYTEEFCTEHHIKVATFNIGHVESVTQH